MVRDKSPFKLDMRHNGGLITKTPPIQPTFKFYNYGPLCTFFFISLWYEKVLLTSLEMNNIVVDIFKVLNDFFFVKKEFCTYNFQVSISRK